MCLGREWLTKTVRYEYCNFAEGDDILYHSSKNLVKTIHEGGAGKRKKWYSGSNVVYANELIVTKQKRSLIRQTIGIG